jgi:hypothetical protein
MPKKLLFVVILDWLATIFGLSLAGGYLVEANPVASLAINKSLFIVFLYFWLLMIKTGCNLLKNNWKKIWENSFFFGHFFGFMIWVYQISDMFIVSQILFFLTNLAFILLISIIVTFIE